MQRASPEFRGGSLRKEQDVSLLAKTVYQDDAVAFISCACDSPTLEARLAKKVMPVFFSTSVTSILSGTRTICAEREAYGLREVWKPMLPPLGKKSSKIFSEASTCPPNEAESVSEYSLSSP